jgi:ATP synthase protein I
MRVFVIQLVGLAVLSAGLLTVNLTQAYSVLLGGLISIIPNAYFTRWAFRYSGARAAGDVARSFYRGEAGKFVLTVVMFAGVFILVKPLTVELIFGAYILMTIVNWVLALRYLK